MSASRTPQPYLQTGAEFSACGRYRYALSRTWAQAARLVMFVGLNPSRAGVVQDDATVRRCAGFARSWGFGGMLVTNLFAWRAVQPADLRRAADPVGADNDRYLLECLDRADLVVAAWGNHGSYLDRAHQVAPRLGSLHILRLNKSGQPAHPLYLPAGLRPVRWRQQPG